MSSKFNHIGGFDSLPYNSTTRKPTRSSTFRVVRVFKYLILCSVTLSLSVFLPTPWSFLRTGMLSTKVPLHTTEQAIEWKDDVWPLRPQTPWDISTDFPYPRRLEYDVSEGTWLRLDVHPKSGDIVFDMVGDLYCLPATDVAKQTPTTGVTRARPILLGVPFDTDPHFSPEGDRLVFRSDAGLGIENIWVMEWKGCEAMDVRSQGKENGGLRTALELKDSEEDMLSAGIKETAERRYRRLLREGRLGGTIFHLVLHYHPSILYRSQLTVSPTRRTVGFQTHASTLLLRKSSLRNGTLQLVPSALARDGGILFLLLKIFNRYNRRIKSRQEMGLAWLEDHCRLDGPQKITETSRLGPNNLSGMAMTASYTRRTYEMQANLRITKVTSMPLVIFLLTYVIRPPPWDICHLPAQYNYKRDREAGRCFPRRCKSTRTFPGRPYTRFRAPRARQGSSRTQVSVFLITF